MSTPGRLVEKPEVDPQRFVVSEFPSDTNEPGGIP